MLPVIMEGVSHSLQKISVPPSVSNRCQRQCQVVVVPKRVVGTVRQTRSE